MWRMGYGGTEREKHERVETGGRSGRSKRSGFHSDRKITEKFYVGKWYSQMHITGLSTAGTGTGYSLGGGAPWSAWLSPLTRASCTPPHNVVTKCVLRHCQSYTELRTTVQEPGLRTQDYNRQGGCDKKASDSWAERWFFLIPLMQCGCTT